MFNYMIALDDWQFEQSIEGIKISKLTLKDLELPFIRGDGMISKAFALEEVLSVILNENSRKQCNHD